ncbi:hypothetical protein DFH06DRAFT_1150817 [Mycena polygramma]|nr:hypothetical protein DFH06DRAFT_1150817 [Mycena polygramma]
METNPCREVVLYIPVLHPRWRDDVHHHLYDEDGDIIPCLIADEDWDETTMGTTPIFVIDVNFRMPSRRAPEGPVSDLQRGERYAAADAVLMWSVDPGFLPIEHLIIYDRVCTFKCMCKCHHQIMSSKAQFLYNHTHCDMSLFGGGNSDEILRSSRQDGARGKWTGQCNAKEDSTFQLLRRTGARTPQTLKRVPNRDSPVGCRSGRLMLLELAETESIPRMRRAVEQLETQPRVRVHKEGEREENGRESNSLREKATKSSREAIRRRWKTGGDACAKRRAKLTLENRRRCVRKTDIDSEEEGEAPMLGVDKQGDNDTSARTIGDIDRDYEADGQCDICSIPLGPHVDETARAFRCLECELSIQCETCCSEAHVEDKTHSLQEWDSDNCAWGPPAVLEDSRLDETMTKICGACSIEIAAMNEPVPEGTFLCRTCGPLLLCNRCCMSVHRAHPLHFLKIWEEGAWLNTTLGDEGFVYQLGHNGEPCVAPQEWVTPMVVIDWSGVHTVPLRFCECGQFQAGQEGKSEQLAASGWQRSGIVHPGVCATFKVLEASQFIRRRQYKSM